MSSSASPMIPDPEPPRRAPRAAPPASEPVRHLRAVPDRDDPTLYTEAGTTADSDLPPPEAKVIQLLALFAFEALEGSRSVSQLGGWITHEVLEQLTARRAARTERRTLYRDHRRVVATPGPVHLVRPAPRVVEATVVLHAEPRTSAVALRLEYLGGRWRATDLTVI